MGFLQREEKPNQNPTSKFMEWKSNDKSFSNYDKEIKDNVLVKLPLTFLVLEEYHTVKGYSDQDKTGIYSNEVLQIGNQEMEVKTYKGRLIAKGLYKDIKGVVKTAGGNYFKSIYAVTKDGELVNLSFKGAAVSKWSNLTEKGAWKRLKDEWVTVEDVEEHKKGTVKYTTPNFKFNTSLSETEFKMVTEKATELKAWMGRYFSKKEVKPVNEVEVDAVVDLSDLDF